MSATKSFSRTCHNTTRTTVCASTNHFMAIETEPSLIKLDGITKVFYTDEVETHALSGIHLDIRRGEYVSIAGPSGCGKSTLLSILGLLDSPTEGSYTLNNNSVANLG